jgi:hypothetical protein
MSWKRIVRPSTGTPSISAQPQIIVSIEGIEALG